MNRDLENMIKESMARLDESMSINVSSSTEGGKNITVTASEEDAVKLAEILKNAGLGGGAEGAPHDEPHGAEDTCPTCGSADCGCGDVHEALDENNPDWPTNPEVSDDALQYAGGLNGPKSTGQTVGAPFNRQNARQGAGDLVGNGVNEEFARFKDLAKRVGGAVKTAAKKGIETLGHGSDEDLIKDLQKKVGVPQTGKKPESGKVAESLRAALEQYKKQ